mmetsp:Transcript_9823/g.18976  ORF Transcript_9823/g.18976 Transcript_9823/m.18976 type:complete len:826 (+) Transcript_9823:239-2716(+)
MEQVMVKQEDTSEGLALTPARTTADFELKKNNTIIMTTETKTVPKTVTPPEASAKEDSPGDSNDKQVRFGKDQVGPTPEHAQDHSTRRGRYASSPGKSHSAPGGAVLEFKTYRSPSRKRDEEVPSLCSTSSDAPAEKSSKNALPTSSISVDPTQATTSPLASHEGEKNEKHAQEKEKYKTDEAPASPIRSEQVGSIYDGTLSSPGNYFLSPNPLTPRGAMRTESFDEKKNDDKSDGKPSPRADRDHIMATPTNFATDYGKQVTESFDTANVLAWLQSPTAHGLFSPGGLGSVTNTPAVRTPRTPTVTTSFFFSDVASLPRNEQDSPKPEENDKKSQKSGISNIICISPLASSRNRTSTPAASTPMNFKDFFASPRERARSMPLLSDTPSKTDRLKVPQRSASKDPSLDAVHLAERDLMEDEDLSVLLKLASNTPRPGERGSGPVGPVFRSPGRRNEGDQSNVSGLQIPMIGNNARDNETKRLMQKSSRSRDHGETSKDDGSKTGSTHEKSDGSKTDDGKKPATSAPQQNSIYGVPPAYRADMPHYYPPMPAMPPGVPPGRSGSMRVVVGVPPPKRDSKTGSPGRAGVGPHGGPPPGYPHEYPPHNGMPFPHPPYPGMHPSGPYGPYGGMARYPPYGHYPPPPRHMPMYNAQNPPGGAPAAGAKDPKKAKTPKSNGPSNKRGSPLLESKNPGSNKKARKSPQKKKNRSPQPETAGDRQKSAASIQAVNAASGGKNDRAAALAAAILRGVTMRPSGKWQAQLYFAGKSRYIGVFDTREKAALAYEIAREKLKSGPSEAGGLSAKSTENLVNAARKAAFEGVNERAPK